MVAEKLKQLSKQNQLPRVCIKELSQKYNVSRWCIARICHTILPQMEAQQRIKVCHQRTGVIGRKKFQVDISRLCDTPLHQRTTLNVSAKALGVHRSTIARWVRRRQIKKVSNTIKPYLNDNHKLDRVRWVLSSLIIPKLIREIPKFRNMYNFVHIDEKWFCLSKLSQRY